MTEQFNNTGAIAGLDHVGLYAPALDAIASAYTRLGFRLTPVSQHSGTNAVTRQVVKSGIANRCAMLKRGYIELLVVVDPALDPRGIPEGLARYAGMHILAFRTDVPEQAIATLQAAGFAATGGVLQRQIDTPEGAQLARFSQVRTPRDEMPEGLILMLQHETPELLWQERYLDHPNGAVGLDEVVVAVDDLDAAEARYTRYFGCGSIRANGEARFALRHGALVLADRASLNARFPGIRIPVMPFPAALVVSVSDLDKARHVFSENRVACEWRDQQLVTRAEDAGGVIVILRQEA